MSGAGDARLGCGVAAGWVVLGEKAVWDGVAARKGVRLAAATSVKVGDKGMAGGVAVVSLFVMRPQARSNKMKKGDQKQKRRIGHRPGICFIDTQDVRQ